MATRRYQIFVSSTLEDLQPERQKVWQTLVSMNYLVSGMETFPATTGSQLAYIERQIAASDYLVLLIAGRYGSIDSEGVSFTEREFDLAVKLGVPVLCFPHRRPENIKAGLSERDADALGRLQHFRTRATVGRTAAMWDNPDELALAVLQSIQNATSDHPRPGWVRGDQVPDEERVAELETLRRVNAELQAKLKLASEFAAEPLVPQRLIAKMKFSYMARRGAEKEAASASISLVDVLRETSVTEKPNHDLFEEALRGAISRYTTDDYDNIEVAWEETDRVILKLANEGVIQFSKAMTGSMIVQFGPKWIAAHALAKS